LGFTSVESSPKVPQSRDLKYPIGVVETRHPWGMESIRCNLPPANQPLCFACLLKGNGLIWTIKLVLPGVNMEARQEMNLAGIVSKEK
jgi:hypothetical protein